VQVVLQPPVQLPVQVVLQAPVQEEPHPLHPLDVEDPLQEPVQVVLQVPVQEELQPLQPLEVEDPAQELEQEKLHPVGSSGSGSGPGSGSGKQAFSNAVTGTEANTGIAFNAVFRKDRLLFEEDSSFVWICFLFISIIFGEVAAASGRQATREKP
jgi:hypothetical protein